MKIGKKFSTLTLKEYQFFIENNKKYTDFNTLGLYRSMIENEKLTLEEKLALREFAHGYFKKSFDFLQLKDPFTYVRVSTLGQELTVGDEKQIWKEVFQNQQKILKDKNIKHRSFGIYSKHNCGYDNCPFPGLMLKKGSRFLEQNMHFESDKDDYASREKSERRKTDRKNEREIIDKLLDSE